MPELTLIFKSDSEKYIEVHDLVDQMLGVSPMENVTVTDGNGLQIYPWPKTKYKIGDKAWTWTNYSKGDWRPAECEILGVYPELDYDDEDNLHWRFFYVISKNGRRREVEEFAMLETKEEAEAHCKECVERGW